MARSPHIWIAGLIASGGLGFFNSFETAKANKSLPVTTNFVGDKTSDQEVKEINLDKPFLREGVERVTSDSDVTPPMQLQLRADRQSYDSRQKRFVAEGRVSATLNGAC